MKTSSWVRGFAAVVMVLVMVATVRGEEDDGYLTITDPSMRKAPIAVPLLKSVTKTAGEVKLADDAAKTLSALLDFTGYFKLVDRAAFLEEPSVKGIELADINFKNWTLIGTELLVTGCVTERAGAVIVDFYLYDIARTNLLVSKRYRGKTTDIREIARRFGTEIIRKFTGSEGLFFSKIAFASTGSGNKEVYICDFDGFNPRQVTKSRTSAFSPAWSSDGTMIAYTSFQKGKPDIYVKNLVTGTVTLLTAVKGTNITPAWVPGSTDIAAALSYNGGMGIYLLTREGKIRNRITNKWSEWGIEMAPCFSPDGKNMAFVSNRSGNPQIFVQNLDSGSVRRLTYQGKHNTTPSWSPNGKKVAYTGRSSNGLNDIYVIDANGGAPEQLTSGAGDNESPAWAPDGSMIAFSSTREGPSKIFVMNANGSEQRKLLALPGEQTNPKWSTNSINK
jgi:TolB protein